MAFIYFDLVFLSLLHPTYNECSSMCLNNFMIFITHSFFIFQGMYAAFF